MKRRDFVKGAVMAPLVPASAALLSIPILAEAATPDKAAKAAKKAGSAGGKVPDYAGSDADTLTEAL